MRSVERPLLGLLVALSVQVVCPERPIRGAEAGALTLVLSADTEGQVGPCATCPSQRGVGGLLARASALRELRAAEPGLLLVDAGNAFFGSDSAASGGEIIRAAYEQLGYDVVNLSFRDFRLGKQKTLDLIRGRESVFVSANLLDAESGKLLAKPFIVKGSAGSAVALLGVTEAPAGWNYLPHLKAQLGGVRIRPPAEAVAEWLPRAKSEAARVILIYYGGAGGLEPLLRAHGKDFSCVLVGGARPESLPSAASPPLFGTGEHGTQLARVSISGAGKDAKAELMQVALDPVRKDAPEMEAVLAGFEKPVPAADADATGAASSPPLPPHTLEPDRSYRLGSSAQNRAIRLTIESAALVSRYGAFESPRGHKLLLLETEWENRIPWTIVQEAKIPTEYRIPNLADHLYVVLNGVTALRILPEAADLPGHVTVKDFKLAKIGDRIRGNVLFEVPTSSVESLELRFYDFAHGHFQSSLIRSSAPPAPAPKPKSPPQRNEVLEVGVFGVESTKEHAGVKAPDEMTFVVVDLRARSLFSVEADATAFDPKARAGAKTRVGTVADWQESRRYTQLVVNGEVAFAPLPSSTLTEEPRFLPDVLTGGSVVFLAPEKTVSLELRCDFPNAKSSLDGRLFRPQGITIPIEGKRPKLEARKAILAIQDDVFDVAVIELTTPAELAGQAAAEGQRFVALDITVSNTGKKGEFFQPLEQLKLVLAAGTLLAVDPAALDGVRAPLPLIWIPPGERRSFQSVYRVPSAEAKLRLAYAGVSLQKTLNLPAIDAVQALPPATVAKPVPAPAKPGEKPAPEASTPAKEVTEKPAPPLEKPRTPDPTSPTPKVESRGDAPQLLRTDRKPQGLAGVGLTPEKVNEAIDRGAAFLWGYLKEKDFKENHYTLGQVREHTIATLALVHAGAHKKFSDLDAGLRAYLPAIDPRRGDIYQAGIACMTVEAYGDPSFLPTLRAASRYILEVQGAAGSWTYSRIVPDGVMRDPGEDRVIQVSGGAPLDGSDAAPPTTRITSWKDGVDGDNSVSQYAVLGLQAASRSGAPIALEAWQRAFACFQSRQGDDGNWSYHTKTPSGYGSMTCAGICSLAITSHELGVKTAEIDAAIEKGLVWLGKRFSVSGHPEMHPPESWFFYYLYSLERVGRVLGLDFIGTHEWYPEGARQLLTIQKPDGSWSGKNEESDPRLATSLALLFLTRSTPALTAETVKRGGDGLLKTGIQLPRGSRYYLILDASGSMTAEMDGKTKWQIAKDAVARLVEDLAEGSEVALRVYGHRKRAIEEGASEDTALEIPLRRLVKKEFLAKLESLRPRGKTPMARSLLEAKKDLASAVASDPVTVLLLTDGGEDTLPRQDPLRAAAEFGELKGVRLHVIGFDIGREDWSVQLQAMAERGQGSYWPALKAESLYAELRSAVFGVPAGFSVLDSAGVEAASGPFGKDVKLREGRYVFHAGYGGVDYEEAFWINTERTTSVVFNAARVTKLKQTPGAVSPGAAKPETKLKFCSDCGKPLKPEAKFCASCGAKVKG